MSPRHPLLIGLLLAALTAAVYAGVRGHDFVNLDDDVYVTNNPPVQAGLTGAGLRWAWTTLYAGYWQPLTWMSLQLDVTLFGKWAGGFHLTNLALHIANVVLLFALLTNMTGAVWRSAFAAALFALHPLHVESVAWVTERKDVLSTFFLFLTLGAYLAWVRRPHLGRYLLVAALLALGLMAKPMLVTAPCLLLLLDYWPLGRLRIGTGARAGGSRLNIGSAVWEKLPLFAVAAVFGTLTAYAQRRVGAVASLEMLPLSYRVSNAPVAYVRYLGKMLWPADLAAYYPHPEGSLPLWQPVAAGLLLLGVTALVLWQGRRRPYLPVGWLWFVGSLFPVSGVLQAGAQALADRFAYIPNIGLYLIAAWGLHDLLASRRYAPALGGALAAAALAVCAVLTVRQVGYWRDSETLWRHTLAVTGDNAIAHNNLGGHLVQQGMNGEAEGRKAEAIRKYEEAAGHFARATEVRPLLSSGHYNLAEVYFRLDRLAEAARHYRLALEADPRMSNAQRAHHKLGLILLGRGELNEARGHFARAVQLDPSMTDAHGNLGLVALRQGRPEDAALHGSDVVRARPADAEGYNLVGVALARLGRGPEAVGFLQRAVELAPGVVAFRCNLAHALYGQGDTAAARAEYRAATELDPRWPEKVNETAWRLATAADPKQRDAAAALALAEQVCQAADSPRPEFLDTLAAARAAAGRFPEAADAARQALELARSAGRTELAAQIADRLRLYEDGKSYSEDRPPPPGNR
jgi:tetratricopeptide (TPR) repeat protein